MARHAHQRSRHRIENAALERFGDRHTLRVVIQRRIDLEVLYIAIVDA